MKAKARRGARAEAGEEKTMMEIGIRQVEVDEKEILRNLLEKYLYEFSQWDRCDVNALGLYGYDYLDHYWTQSGRHAFFIDVNNCLAGFVMVNDHPAVDEPTDYAMAEFFVMHKYRRGGVGREAVRQIFERFKGRWQIRCHPKNEASVRFWDSVVSEYTRGNYRVVRGHKEAGYIDGTWGDVYFFEI